MEQLREDTRSRPMYMRVVDVLRRAILAGEFPAGAKLPGRRAIGEQLGAAPMTVNNALRELARVGAVETRQGDGTYVTARAAEILTGNYSTAYDTARLLEQLEALAERLAVVEGELAAVRGSEGPQVPHPR